MSEVRPCPDLPGGIILKLERHREQLDLVAEQAWETMLKGFPELQKQCPYLEVCREYGFETPCGVICEMDIEASRRAFPEMKGEILCRQALGSPVCIFKYERPARKDADSDTHAASETVEDRTSR